MASRGCSSRTRASSCPSGCRPISPRTSSGSPTSWAAELTAPDIWDAFRRAYFVKIEPRHFRLVDYEERKATDETRIFAGTIAVDGREQSVSGRGNGLISSVVATLQGSFGIDLEVRDYTEHALGAGSDARAAAYLECALPDGRTVWGCGIDSDIATASVRAVLSAANGMFGIGTGSGAFRIARGGQD